MRGNAEKVYKMPFETKLEWAKDICTRQGYTVIPLSSIQELHVRAAISLAEWDIMKNKTSFHQHMWHQLGRQIGAKIIDDDRCVLKTEYEAADTMSHIMQARVWVICG
jgi:hypothetical protein